MAKQILVERRGRVVHIREERVGLCLDELSRNLVEHETFSIEVCERPAFEEPRHSHRSVHAHRQELVVLGGGLGRQRVDPGVYRKLELTRRGRLDADGVDERERLQSLWGVERV